MLEGQEISEVNFSDVLKASYSQRIDSTFFSKEFLNNPFSQEFLTLNELCEIRSGTTPADRDDDLQEGVVLLKTDSIRNGILNYFSAKDFFFIDIDSSLKMKSTALQRDDVLMNIVGATTDVIGRCSVLSADFPPANITQAMALLRIKDDFKSVINPSYLFAYLSSKQGHKQVRRIARPTGQYNMNLQEVGSFLIPLLSIELQAYVEKLIKNSESLNKDSVIKYAQAEQTLLEAVGLADFKPSTQSTNIKTFAQSFGTSGRLDAEYYQPKYDYLENVFNQYERIKLQDLVNYPISSGITPKAGGDDYTDAENGVPFVRAVDLQNGLVSINNFNYIKPEIHTGALKRTQLKQNDFLFSIAGTVGRCAIFQHTFEANINQAVAILRFNDARVNPYYLMVFFNSYIGKEFVEKYSRQGLQTNLNLSEVGDLSIPIIDLSTQTNISQLVQQSFSLKAQSEQLLNVAKRAVEMAIEQDETVAMAWIAGQM